MGMLAAAAKSVARDRLTERMGSMLCCVKLPNCGDEPVSGLSVARMAESAANTHFLSAKASSWASVSPVAHFCPSAVNSLATWRLRALAMYSCTIERIGDVNRERPSGCLPSGRNVSATMRGSPIESGTHSAAHERPRSPRVSSQTPRGV